MLIVARHVEKLLFSIGQIILDLPMKILKSIQSIRQKIRPGRHYPRVSKKPLVGFVHQFKNLGKGEVEFIISKYFSKLGVNIDETDFGDQEAVSTIIRMTNGNFRLINRLLKQSYQIRQVNCMTH